MQEERSGGSQRGDGAASQEGFLPGAIVRITLKDFMTYSSASMHPGPRLNVVLGPNGTGKSSVVCGIGLALGGKPKILGRAKTVGSFVRSGCQSGWVEIELYRPKKNIVIKREIFLNNASNWYLNGRKSTSEAVQAEVDALNVQVSNLCQFLAQDRVKEFAKMTPVQLLEETERAVGGVEMLEVHKRLMAQQSKRKDLARNVTVMSEKLTTLKQLNAELEREVERYQQRQQLLDRAKLVKQKLAWVRVALKNDERELATQRLKEQLERVVQLKEALSSSDEVGLIEKEIEACKANVARLRKQQRDADTARTKAQNTVLRLTNECSSLEEEIKNSADAREQSLRKIASYRNEIVKLEKKIAEMPDPKNTAPELASVSKKIESLAGQIRKTQETEKQLSREARDKETAWQQKRDAFGRLENDRKIREDRFRSQHGDLYGLLRWARENASQFKGRVGEPIALEIMPVSEVAATRLEQLIPKNVLTNFLVDNNDDLELMRKKAKEMRIYGFGAFVQRGAVSEDSLEREIPGPISKELKSMGVLGWACETFTAPLHVRGALCVLHPALWKTMYADKPVAAMDKVQAVQGAMGLVDGVTHYQFKRSRYGNRDFSVSTARYNGQDKAKLLCCGSDPAKKAALQQEVETSLRAHQEAQERQNALNADIKSLMAERRLLETRKAELSDIPRALADQQKRIDSRKTMIRDEESTDHEEELRKLQVKMDKSKAVLGRAIAELAPPLKSMLEASLELDGETVRLLDLEDRLAKLEEQLEQEKTAVKAAEKEVQRLKAERDKLKIELDAVKQQALKLCKITPELSARFKNEVPQESLAELEQEMYNLEQQASAIFASSEDVVRQYEQRKAEIADQEEELSGKQAELDQLNKSIIKDKTLWLHGREAGKDADHPNGSLGLMELVKRISESFGKYMAENSCSGEVRLAAPDDDFASYAIEIKVSFRSATKLATLSAEFHSGGERSVSTMMYLISLQPLTPAPFRLVDEINQAMDPANERRIWEQVVAASSGPQSPQYFLVTPKLLSDLTYSDSIVVHVIFNGVYNVKQEEWNTSSRFSKREREAQEEDDDDF